MIEPLDSVNMIFTQEPPFVYVRDLECEPIVFASGSKKRVVVSNGLDSIMVNYLGDFLMDQDISRVKDSLPNSSNTLPPVPSVPLPCLTTHYAITGTKG